MMSKILVILIVFLVQREVADASTFHSGSVYCKNKQCHFKPGVIDTDTATAVGTFNDTLLISGWGILDISAGHAKKVVAENIDIMYAAGYMEGVFTARHMDSHYKNMRNAMLPPSKKELYTKLKAWFAENRQWTHTKVAQFSKYSAVWRHVGYVFAQLDGLLAGYKSVSANVSEPLDEFALSFLNGLGDILDLQRVLDKESRPDWTKFTEEEARTHFNTRGHCSALIKLLPGFENIFMSHSSWFKYQATNRIYKHYNFNVNDSDTANKKISFASYPGYLESQDDFYILGEDMVVLQTTINVYDYSLYDKVKPQSLLSWHRVRIASMMANDGYNWTRILGYYNSGTYNNEYMVIDLKKFTPKQPLQGDTLWVADQLPGLVVTQDATEALRDGYFPSYNVPFFDDAYYKMGYDKYAKAHGPDYSYTLAPRAKIFRRDQSKIRNLSDMKKTMRYNDYKHDPYSGGSPFGAICSRGDLQKNPSTDGCFDTKVTDYTMAKAFQADVINGPTLGNDLPVFSWTGPFADIPHNGLPPSYNFTFLGTQPRFP